MIIDQSSAKKEVQLPPSHPKIEPSKVGVLLINLGTPSKGSYFSVRKYLAEFLSDKRVIDYPSFLWKPLLYGIILTIRPFRSGKNYRAIWDRKHDMSPLLVYTSSICNSLKIKFGKLDSNIIIDYAMRYGEPSIKDRIKKLVAKGCNKIVLFALYPQYSATTTATAYDKAFDSLKELNWQPAIRTSPSWHNNSHYIDLLAQTVKNRLKSVKIQPEVIVNSFHGLPERYLTSGDPYYCFCVKTSRLVQEKLNWPSQKWITAFQSRFGFEEWLKPYTIEVIKNLARQKVKNIAVLAPSFTCDCIETLEEISMQIKEAFLKEGGENFYYIPCLNDSSGHIDLLYDLISCELKGWVTNS